jgi:hypothetical protein
MPTPVSVNPVDYGAAFDGVTDDTAAWAATVAAAVASNLSVKAPPGTSLISAPIVIPQGMAFEGSGSGCTTIAVAGGNTGIDVQTADQVLIAHLTVNCLNAGQIGINVTPAATNLKSEIADVGFQHCAIAARMGNAANWTLHDCNFSAAGLSGATGIYVANPVTPDSGDSTIYGNLISGNGATGSVGISQVSSGGLRIENNKIIHWTYGYLMQLAAGVATSDLIIVGNSIEHSMTAAVTFNKNAGATFGNVVIVGNQIGTNTPTGIWNAGGAGWLQGVGIVANRLNSTTNISMAGVTGLVTANNF